MTRRSDRQTPHSESVTIEYKGKPYSGTWYVQNDWLYVSTDDYGDKSAKAGAGPAVLARILLRELVQASTG